MEGVVVVDKPPGMTSHDVTDAIRRVLADAGVGPPRRRRRPAGPKVGHTGTLDPDATGVLVVCIGRATRLVPYLQGADKTYEARMRLGVETTTLDAAGDVVAERDAGAVDEHVLCEALKSMIGPISQRPPMVSAVRVDGQRLHERARRGEVVERTPRAVTVHELVLEDFSPGARAEAGFLVTCSAGTYVRVLAADVGEALGTGAHLLTLRRLAAGRFTLEQTTGLDEVLARARTGSLEELLLPPATAVADLPRASLGAEEARSLRHGRPVDATGHDGPVAAVDQEGRLLAILADRDGRARPELVFAPAEASGG